jgi:hypothetical protein
MYGVGVVGVVDDIGVPVYLGYIPFVDLYTEPVQCDPDTPHAVE